MIKKKLNMANLKVLKELQQKQRLVEALTKSDEREIERLIRSIIREEQIEKKVEKLVRDELKGKATERIVIQIVRNAMSSLYKTLWFRRSTWLNGIENKDS